MNEISCEVCMDLMPLVQDGVASEDSRKAVEAHVAGCEACRAQYKGKVPPAADADKALKKLQRKLRFAGLFLMMLGIFAGLALTAREGMFYNLLIMPVIGALGYLVFRKKTLYELPVLLVVMHLAVNGINWLRGLEFLDLYSIFFFTVIYIVLAQVGALIAALFHYAFQKEGKK